MRDSVKFKGSQSPCDYILWDGVSFVAIEAKLLRARKNSNPRSFPFSRVPEHQVEGLLEIDEIPNSKAYVMVNFRWVNNAKGLCYAVPIKKFIKLKKELTRKSIPLEIFENECIELDRLGSGWNLELLM